MRIRIPFTKMSGAGNDFVVIDNRLKILKSDPADFVQAVSQRRLGVGADGVLLIERSGKSDFALRYFNADGSYGGFCGNGGRCAARYAYLKRIAPASMKFESLGHIYHAEVSRNRVRLSMKVPKDEKLHQSIQCDGMQLRFHTLNTGSPHAVCFLDENPSLGTKKLVSLDVVSLGRKIRYHRYFGKAGTNVNFVSWQKDGSLQVRTYERGVEDETWACGTGAVASALLANRLRAIASPVKIIPRSNQPLVVSFEKVRNRYHNVYLEGNADIIFSGVLVYDSASKKLVSSSV